MSIVSRGFLWGKRIFEPVLNQRKGGTRNSFSLWSTPSWDFVYLDLVVLVGFFPAAGRTFLFGEDGGRGLE